MSTEFELHASDEHALQELGTAVAISGSPKQQEVGGAICLGIAAGIIVYMSF